MGHALKLKSTERYRYLPFTASFRWLYYEKKKQNKTKTKENDITCQSPNNKYLS